jgi:selenide,water dikinase
VEEERRLTTFSHGAGCGCKLGPNELQAVLSDLSIPEATEDLLVATDTGDDAAVYRIANGMGLIATLDFFTPIVDDPYDWGRIAATNALSDVYAMGGTPFLALNIVDWPVDELPLETLGKVLQGGIDVASKAGVMLAGGHSITDPEPKYGMVALGIADAERLVRNSTAPAGADLYLTKPLGFGIVSTAVKRGIVDDDLYRTAVDQMTTLNDAAAAAMLEVGAEAATDVTGFGLLGHLQHMLAASGVSALIDASAVPVLDGILELAERGVVPGGTHRNHDHVWYVTDWGELDEPEQYVLADAQTSGGMLIVTTRGPELEEELRARGVLVARIGRTEGGEAGRIRIEGRVGTDRASS